MNFREWLEQTLSKADPRLYGEKEDAMEAAWEASKAEERERVASKLTELAEHITHDETDYISGFLLQLAEQIRKGE